MHKGIVLVKEPGSEIPDDILNTAAKLYDTGYGVAVVSDMEGTKAMQVSAETFTAGDIPPVENMKNTLGGFPNDRVILSVFKQEVSGEEEIEEDDLQPFVPFFTDPEKEEGPILAVFIEGDLLKKWDKGEGYSPSFYFYKDYLKPNLERMAEAEGIESIDDLFEELASNGKAQEQFLQEAGDKCTITFYAQNGKHVSCYLHKDDRNFDWGWLSNGVGFETPTIGKKKGGLKPSIALSKGSTLLPADKNKVQDSTPAPAAPTRGSEIGMVRVPIPRGLSNKDRKKWLYRATGTNPHNWKELSDVTISRAKAKELGVLPEQQTAIGSQLGEYPAKAAEAAAKAAVTESIQKAQPEIPMIPADARKKGDLFFSTVKIPDDPASFKDMEAKMSTWADQTGRNLEDIFKWPFGTIKKYVQDIPEEAAVLLFYLRNLYMSELAKPEPKTEAAPAEPKKKGFLKAAK